MCKFSSIKAYLLLAALVLLLLPNLLFLIGWFRPFIAIPFCCFLAFSVLVIWHKSKTAYLSTSSALVCSRGDVIKLLICLIFSLMLVETISFHGHFYQTVDFFVRNPIYQSLIDRPWPLYNNKGEYFVYYHAFWLPPALIAKFVGSYVSPATVLFLWSYLYLASAILLLFSKIKGRVLTFCVVFFVLGTIVPDFCHVTAKISEPVYEPLSKWMWRYGLEGYIGYMPFWSSCTYNFNSALPGVLCLSLLFSGLLPKRYWCVPAAFIVQPSLLCAAALFIWMMLYISSHRHVAFETLKSIHTWGCALFVLFVLLFFHCLADGASDNGIHVVFSTESYIGKGCSALSRTIRATLLSCSLVLSLYFVLEKRLRKSTAFVGGCLVASIIPFIWVGTRNNEFLYKGSIVMFFLFSWVLTVQWKHACKTRKGIISVFLLLSSLHITREIHARHFFLDYGWSREKIERHVVDPYHGSIDNMTGYIHDQFFTQNRVPSILR